PGPPPCCRGGPARGLPPRRRDLPRPCPGSGRTWSSTRPGSRWRPTWLSSSLGSVRSVPSCGLPGTRRSCCGPPSAPLVPEGDRLGPLVVLADDERRQPDRHAELDLRRVAPDAHQVRLHHTAAGQVDDGG